MTSSPTVTTRVSPPRALWGRFLLRERERIAAACAPGARDAVGELARAGASRASVAEHLLEGHAASALALYREAAVFHLAAYLAARTGDGTVRGLRADDVLTRFRALDPPAPLAGSAASREAFLESVRARDALAVDEPDPAPTREAAEAARDVVRELADLVEPRGVSELRFLRGARLVAVGLVAVALVVALVASHGSRTNLALHKPVTTSGVHPNATSPPSGLTDGETSGAYGVHTQVGPLPWVTVDLLAAHEIDRIKIYNRNDGWFDDGLPLTVQLSTNGVDFADVATRTTSFTKWTIEVPRRKARYVRVHSAAGKYVALSELEVFGDP